MIVYIASHKQQLDTEEILEASHLCEEVGNDYFGQGRWFIEGKQRKIADHFHWHVRELKMVNDIIGVKVMNADPIIGGPLLKEVESHEKIKEVSLQLLSEQVDGKPYLIMEKRLQRGLAVPAKGNLISISSRVRFSFDGIWAIEQTVVQMKEEIAKKQKFTTASIVPYVLMTIYYRVKVGKSEGNELIAKL
jgi:hypothetical protein